MRHEVIEDIVAKHIPERAYAEQWDAAGLKTDVQNILNLDLPIVEWASRGRHRRGRYPRAHDRRSRQGRR